MAVSLEKGQTVSLTKENPLLKRIHIGLGWDPAEEQGVEFDVDVSLFMLNSTGQVRMDCDMIYYNNLEAICHSIVHTGDNRTGEGDGDDEVILCDLSNLEESVRTLAIVVTIHDAVARRQNFGQVDNIYIRIVDQDTEQELQRYDLREEFSTETAIHVADVYRLETGEWKFRAVGRGYRAGLGMFAEKYGVEVAERA